MGGGGGVLHTILEIEWESKHFYSGSLLEIIFPPPIMQLGGNHKVLFEGYWSMLDPQKTGKIDAVMAATFLKKSQLREPVLHKVPD